MENKQKRQLLWLTLLATIVWSALMTWEAFGYRQPSCLKVPTARGVTAKYASPIGALTITQSKEDFERLIDRCSSDDNRLWNIHVAQTNTCMDFLFIALYGGVFLLFASVLGGRLAIWVRAAIVLTMLMDVGENVLLLVSMHALAYPANISDSLAGVHPPGVFSMLKWILFSLSLFLLAGVFFTTREVGRWWRILMAGVSILSGLSVIAGLFYIPLLGLGVLLLGLALLVALGLFFPIRPFSVSQFLLWIQVFYLLRFQIIGGLLLAVVLPVLYFTAPSIFIGIFDALGRSSFVFVVWIALQLAWTVMITSQMIFVYGPERYSALAALKGVSESGDDSPNDDRLSWTAVGCFGALALPTIIMAIGDTSSICWWEKILGLLLSVALAVLILWLTSRLHVWIEQGTAPTARQLYPKFGLNAPPEDDSRTLVGRTVDRALDRVMPNEMKAGILTSDGRLRSGHRLATTVVAVLLVVYLFVGVVFAPSSHYPAPAALFFLLFLLTLMTWTFSGLAFFLDMLRVPVLTSFLVVSLLFGTLYTDHTFKGEARSTVQPSPQQVIQAWESARGKDPKLPIVVVATAGGGIRASAWTAEVLTGMAKDCRQDDGSNLFTSSLLLVSSVSGGSEGTMYLLGAYDGSNGSSPLGDLSDKVLKDVRDNSAASDLSAVGWGVLYPDLLRTVPGVGSLVGWRSGLNLDRGWALENQWIKNTKDHPLWPKPPTMSDWIEDTKKGSRPAVIFNVTASETGQRMVVASTSLPESRKDDPMWPTTALQFSKAYPDLNIPVATAARLSASFAWVSPMPRSERKQDSKQHFADGGYFDNSGLLSASDWLLAARGSIDRPILLVVIDATEGEHADPEPWSWQRQLVGPVSTLNSVRSGSQKSRSDFEVPLVRAYLHSLIPTVQVDSFIFNYPKDRLAPLSWHLTPEQRLLVGEAWASEDSDISAKRKEFYRALGCQANQK
jgi:hypothetical protein